MLDLYKLWQYMVNSAERTFQAKTKDWIREETGELLKCKLYTHNLGLLYDLPLWGDSLY